MDDQHTDVNSIAGLLGGIFAVDVTATPRRCHSCGETSVLAAHRVYRSAGIVVRCPDCGDVALRIGLLEERMTLEWHGVMQMPVPEA